MGLDASILLATAVLYGLLAVASVGGAVCAAPGSSLRAQINAWWRIFPLVSLSMLLVPLGPMLLCVVISLLALRELAPLAAPDAARRRHTIGAGVGVLLLQSLLSLREPALASGCLFAVLILQAAYFAWRRGREQLVLLLFVLLVFALSFVPQLLRLTPSAPVNLRWYFYLFVVTALNDIAQFIAGKTFGRHRIAARISPQKTWQGLAGGVLASVVVSVVLGGYLQLAGFGPLIVLALLLAPAGFLGDLLFSAAKRWLGIKDFSNLIPGHGGMLDRADSLVLTAPLLYLALVAFPI
jgi:phosphatidate cytidylyltransferase